MSDSKKISLYTAATPNGVPVSIVLEELGLEYDVHSLSFATNEQKQPEYLKINPNGRIPAIQDHSRNDMNVFETSAILLYLCQHYDKSYLISFDPAAEADLYSEMLQWMMFAHGGLGPMQGQAHHFVRYAPEQIEYGIKRYKNETKRLYSVLEERLKDRNFLVGDKYSLADIKAFPWVRIGAWAGVELEEFPAIQAWISRCESRPATDKGLRVPKYTDPKVMMQDADKKAKEARGSFLGLCRWRSVQELRRKKHR